MVTSRGLRRTASGSNPGRRSPRPRHATARPTRPRPVPDPPGRRPRGADPRVAGFHAPGGITHDQADLRPGRVHTIGGPRRCEGEGREAQRARRIRGDQMNPGCPASPAFPDGLRPVLPKAPEPPGCALTMAPSGGTAPTLTRTIRPACRRSKSRSGTPALLQRSMRTQTVCRFPDRAGSPLHLQPCPAAWRMALGTWGLVMPTLPRCRGRTQETRGPDGRLGFQVDAVRHR